MTEILFAVGGDGFPSSAGSSAVAGASFSLSTSASAGSGESGNDASRAASLAVEDDEVRLLSSDLDLDLERSERDGERRFMSVEPSSKVSCAKKRNQHLLEWLRGSLLGCDWRYSPPHDRR
jgi:hypothetical protein